MAIITELPEEAELHFRMTLEPDLALLWLLSSYNYVEVVPPFDREDEFLHYEGIYYAICSSLGVYGFSEKHGSSEIVKKNRESLTAEEAAQLPSPLQLYAEPYVVKMSVNY